MSYGQQRTSSHISGSNFFFELKPVEAWRAVLILIVATAMSILAGGIIAIVTFPLCSLAVGWFFYRRYPLFYCSYVWWMWFVGSLVRRIIDVRCGYITPGPWHFSAGLITGMSVLTLLKYLPNAGKYGGIPFVAAAAACFYGYLINAISQGFGDIDQATFLLFGWLAPITFGFHIFIHWRDYPSYRQNFQRTFLWGVLFMGIYGIVQYIFAPPWDAFFLRAIREQSNVLSFGDPEPFGIRVFSSMDAPQGFAAMIGAGLIVLFSLRGSQQLWANGLGYLSLLLSLARSGWLSFILSILILFMALKSNLKIRMLIGVLMTVLIVLPVTTIEPFSEAIGERVETLDDTRNDGSLKAREGAFNLLIGHALVEFVGLGLQSPVKPDIEIRSTYDVGDNGILVILFALGWMGAFPYMFSLLSLTAQVLLAGMKNNDLMLHIAYAVVLGLLGQIYFKSLFYGSFAMILWGFVGIGMAGHKYYLAKNNPRNTL